MRRDRITSTWLAASATLLAVACNSSTPQGLGDVDAGPGDATPGGHNDASMGGGLTVGPAALPDGQIGVAYSAQLSASGGTAPYHFVLANASMLPAGLTLADDGSISGTPTVAGSTRFDVSVTDSASPASTGLGSAISLNINPPMGTALMISTTTLAHAAVGQPYAATLASAQL
jgi:hypothetical protein